MSSTNPIRMTYGFVLAFPARHFGRWPITPDELTEWAANTPDGRQVFTYGLTLEQAEYLLARDLAALVPGDEQTDGKGGDR